MADWPTKPLADFVDPSRSICYGIVQPGSHDGGGTPIVRVNNFRNGRIDTDDHLRVSSEIESKYKRSRLQGGELLVTLVGTMGLSAIVPEELRGWNIARAVGLVPLREDVDKRWINFVVRSAPAQEFIRVRANTTVQATFNLKDLAQLPVPMPPENFRRAASELLSALDDKVELNRRTNETLEGMARAIFKDWFVDFGPTRAKMAGREMACMRPCPFIGLSTYIVCMHGASKPVSQPRQPSRSSERLVRRKEHGLLPQSQCPMYPPKRL